MSSCKPRPAPILTPENRQQRVNWCNTHSDWTLADWKAVLFSDESRATLDGQDGRIRIWRKSKERFHPDCLLPTQHQAPGLMVWGCFSWLGLGPLIVLEQNVTGNSYSELLEIHVLPTMMAMFDEIEDGVFQDDNAQAHRSHTASAKAEELGIERLPWPAHSPDLNPIENLWSLLKKRIKSKENRPTNIPELRASLDQAWAELAEHTQIWRPLIESMPSRIAAVKKSRGYPINH